MSPLQNIFDLGILTAKDDRLFMSRNCEPDQQVSFPTTGRAAIEQLIRVALVGRLLWAIRDRLPQSRRRCFEAQQVQLVRHRPQML